MSFPRSYEWDYFVEAIGYHDTWYDILSSKDTGKILDYMYEIMKWAKENGVWGEDNFKAIGDAYDDHWEEDYE